MPKLVFTANDLREFQPELAARLETAVRDGAADERAARGLAGQGDVRRAEAPGQREQAILGQGLVAVAQRLHARSPLLHERVVEVLLRAVLPFAHDRALGEDAEAGLLGRSEEHGG